MNYPPVIVPPFRTRWFLGVVLTTLLMGSARAETGFDDAAARKFADAIASDFIAERYKELRERFEKPFKDTVPEDGVSPVYQVMYTGFGKPLEVGYSQVIRGQQYRVAGKRPWHRYWYDVRTTKAEMGKYFLWIDIVLEDDHLACSGISYAMKAGPSKGPEKAPE